MSRYAGVAVAVKQTCVVGFYARGGEEGVTILAFWILEEACHIAQIAT